MKKAIIIALFVVVSIAIHVYIASINKADSSEKTTVEALHAKYPLLSRRILAEFPNDVLINFLPLRKDLRKVVEPYGESFGFYFEYLPTGTNIGVNSTAEFMAASLFKVPVVMAYYHMRERLGKVDDPVVTIEESQIDKGFGNLWIRGAGATIDLNEAVKLALTDSDNTAVQIVAAHMEKEDLERVYEGLDIDLKTDHERTIITAKGFTSILKALFFAAVLSKDNSEKILNYMTQTNFNDKLPAGIPQGVKVAHKIGVLDDDVYMDCGIVYAPRRPYMLCMVSASTEDEARRRMIDISQRVYRYVSNLEIKK